MIRKFTLSLGLLLSFALGAQQLIDPTKPKGAGLLTTKSNEDENGPAPIVLTAVFIKSNSKVAVINGESVLEGQSWRGNQVKKINKDGVVLIVDGRETDLLLNQYSIKKDASNDF
ncbi:hypothetical protein [Aliiglaciecola sp. NS0011-25]|uniref:hypothetical protein n=1 Tax=Aliiglaciecola sp. NS0011-25 TaxID=3127654 RepID=UPI003107CCEB